MRKMRKMRRIRRMVGSSCTLSPRLSMTMPKKLIMTMKKSNLFQPVGETDVAVTFSYRPYGLPRDDAKVDCVRACVTNVM
jgi:hypothetical protein